MWWVFAGWLLGAASGLCPSRCLCTDESLQATCSDAGLEVFPIQLNPDVRRIDLPGNRITALHFTLGFYTKLEHLDVSRNRIQTLGSKNFESQGALRHLNASNNKLTVLGKNAFRGLKSVTVIDLSQNSIINIEEGAFRDTENLEKLDLSFNKLEYFQAPAVLGHVRALRYLYLDNNELVDIPTSLLKSLRIPCALEKLTLANNLIRELEEKAFPDPCTSKLRVLTLGYNDIRYIDEKAFDPLHELVTLDLSYNNLTETPTTQLSALRKLEALDLDGNRFCIVGPVAFRSLFKLRILRMSNMTCLNSLHQRAFADNTELTTVYMDYNWDLRRIPWKLFNHSKHITHVSLRWDNLTTVDENHFPKQLKSLDLSGNPLHCNCSLYWLWMTVQKQHKARLPALSSVSPGYYPNDTGIDDLTVNLHGLKCWWPVKMKGASLVEVPESWMSCETKWITVAVVTALVMALLVATCVAMLMFGTGRPCRGKSAEGRGPEGGSPRVPLRPCGPPPVLMLMPPPPHLKPPRYPWGPEEFPGDIAHVKKAPHIVYV